MQFEQTSSPKHGPITSKSSNDIDLVGHVTPIIAGIDGEAQAVLDGGRDAWLENDVDVRVVCADVLCEADDRVRHVCGVEFLDEKEVSWGGGPF